jgi:phage shock protein PspC (stress-responsive transcriptional regulator)
MEKTISINLSGQNFQIEEDAYDKLKTYLENIKRHCGAGADSAEVVADIENSMAEKLKASLTPYKEVITMENIDSLISVMGTVEDFDREIGGTPENSDKKEDEKDQAKDSIKRRLYRDVDNGLLGGVAAGLGAYFGIDPVIFRLIFVALVFAGGFGVALYLLFWLIIPAAKSAHQKLEMQGEAPTIAAFERLSKKSVAWKDDLKRRWKESSWLKKIVSLPFIVLECLLRAFKKVWSKIWPLIRFLFGLGLIVFSLVGLGAISIASFLAILENNSAYHLSYVPISEITATFPFLLVLTTAFLSLVIPVLFLLFAGAIIIRRKNFLNFTAAAILIGLWMISGIICVSLILRYGPDVKHMINNYPQIQNISRTIKVL